jgi:ribosomal protein S18 acetylase RimI-like enzyme
MSKFTFIIDHINVAHQVACLLNMYNNLTITHTGPTILASCTNYIVEQEVVNNKLDVVGCVGILSTNENTTLIKHLCVKKNKRCVGVASRLLNTAINSCTTDYVHMDIRSDNYPSLYLAEKLGFLIITQQPKQGYNVVTVGRNVNYGTRNNRLC